MFEFLRFLKKQETEPEAATIESAGMQRRKTFVQWTCTKCAHVYYYRAHRCLFCSASLQRHVVPVSAIETGSIEAIP